METVFGVIGLTGQVIDTSLKIKNLIEKFKSAEEEFSNLQLKLTFVAKTCAYIQDAIEHDDRQESGLLWEHGTVILTEIGKTLEKLKGLFPKEDASAKKRGKNRQGLYFLRKNDDIESFGKRLDDYLRILHMMITAETNSNQVRLAKRLESRQVVKQKSLVETSHTEELPGNMTEYRECESAIFPRRTTKVILERSARQASLGFGIDGVFDRKKVTKRSKWKSGQETTTVKETKSFTLKHRSSSYAIQLMWWLSGSMSLSISLSVPHMIESRTNDDLSWRFQVCCYMGNIEELQKMFSEGVLTPTTLVDGITIFALAAGAAKPDLCRFILQSDSRLVADESLLHAVRFPRPMLDIVDFTPLVEIADIFLSTQMPTLIQFKFLTSSMSLPKDMLLCFKRFRHLINEDEWQTFINIAWDEAVEAFCRQFTRHDPHWKPVGDMYEDWCPLFGRIVEGGVDVHRFRGDPKRSPALYSIIQSAWCPSALEPALTRWKYILWACGIDISLYLEKEWSMLDMTWNRVREENRLYSWPRRLTGKIIDGFRFPAWERYVELGSPAFEVREEFKDFGPCESEIYCPSRSFVKELASRNEGELHRVWKAPDPSLRKHFERKEWPFRYLPAQTESHADWYRWLDSKEVERVRKAVAYAHELVQSRAEKRQVKRLYKSGYIMRDGKLRGLPGSWKE